MRSEGRSSILHSDDGRVLLEEDAAGAALQATYPHHGREGGPRQRRKTYPMPEPSAHRTLVKSPPELWAELSDVESLARHLGEFGEIRITRLDPETTVAWEGDRARGMVELEPSGWGTKVTITAELAEAEDPLAPEPNPRAAEAEPGAEPLAEAEPETVTEGGPEPLAEPQPEPLAAEDKPEREALAAEVPEPLGDPQPEAVAAEAERDPGAEAETPAKAEPRAAEPEPAPKKGFFARLFGRRHKVEAIVESEPVADRQPEPPAAEAEPKAQPLPAEPESQPLAAEPKPQPLAAEPEPQPLAADPKPEPEPVAAAEPDLEPVAVVAEPEPEPTAPPILDDERVHAILTGVLDDLGSAHHRPFSRS
jgi:hypothetical protein